MISAKDLRIGNAVSYYDGSHIGEILGIKYCDFSSTNEVVVSIKGGGYTKTTLEDLQPVILTESELEKLGIKKQYQENPFKEGKYTLNEDGSRYYSWVKGCFNLEMDKDGKFMFEVYSHYIPLDYVHQLQNLFYLLTNEELTYIK